MLRLSKVVTSPALYREAHAVRRLLSTSTTGAEAGGRQAFKNALPLLTRTLGRSGALVRAFSSAVVHPPAPFAEADPKIRLASEEAAAAADPQAADAGEKADADKRPSVRAAWSRLWKFVKAKVWVLGLAGGLIVAGTLLGVMSPAALGAVFDAFSVGGPVIGPALKLAALMIGKLAFDLFGSILLTNACEDIANSMRRDAFARLLHADVAFFDEAQTAALVSQLQDGVKDVRDTLRTVVGEGVPAAARVVGGAVSLLVLSPKLTVILGAVMSPLFVLGDRLGARLRKLARNSQEAQARTSSRAQETFFNIRAVRAMTGEQMEAEKYSVLLDTSSGISRKIGYEINGFRTLVSIGVAALAALVVGTGSYLEMSKGDITAFMFQTMGLESALKSISIVSAKLARASGAVNHVSDLLELEPVVNKRGGYIPPRIDGDVIFEHVSFAYPGRPHAPVLRDISLHCPPGKTVALVGTSGAGKSTIASLLLGFYNPSAGRVSIDGVPLQLMDMHHLRQHTAFVPQEPLLFNCSIRDNVRYGKPDATEEEIERACKLAHCSDFIGTLPKGLDTFVGERGVALSGGQRQRLMIARALLRDPKILILDEYSSQQDAQSEGKVAAALASLTKGRTTIIIAHRMATIQAADLIYVLSHGRVVESGNHAQLLARNGMYAELVRRQQGSADVEDAMADVVSRSK
jgi:ABC-type multidrug transport system fused ATPase/permease subunit